MTGNLDYNEIVFPKLGIDLHVNSTAFTIFRIDIQWYGVLITSAIIIAIIFALKNMKRVGLDPNRGIDAIIFGVIGGIVGARAYYVIWAWDKYKDNPAEIFNLRNGGLGFYGAFIGALLVGIIVAKIRKIRVLPLLDLVGIGLPFGQAVGRWGNFFNQEAFGGNTDSVFGMTGGKIRQWISENAPNMDPDKPVHPCFLYESCWCLLGLILCLILFYKFRKFDGQIFLTYIGWYGIGRAFIEGLRSDSLYMGNIKISQLLAIIFVVASVIFLIYGFSYVKRLGGEYRLYYQTEESKKLLEESELKENTKKDKKIKSEIKSEGEEKDGEDN